MGDGRGGSADYNQKQRCLSLAGTRTNTHIGVANTQLLQRNKFGIFAIQAAIWILLVSKYLKTYDHHNGRRCG